MAMGLVMIEKNAIKELAALIDDAINSKGMTSKQLAESIGVSMETVRRWRKGENLPSRVGIEAMAIQIGLDRTRAYQLHAQARAEGGEASSLAGLVTLPVTMQAHIDDLEARVSALEEFVRNHIDNH